MKPLETTPMEQALKQVCEMRHEMEVSAARLITRWEQAELGIDPDKPEQILHPAERKA